MGTPEASLICMSKVLIVGVPLDLGGNRRGVDMGPSALRITGLAERIRALGHPAPGTYADYAKLSSIKDAKGVPAATKMISELVAGQEAVVRTARSIFPLVEKANDEPTADLLTQRMQIHEKTAWMLRSLLEK